MMENYQSEEQREICESTAQNILVEGVAGSRKTDTLIRLGLRRHLREGRSLLFLTQVGSVTDEIRSRIEKYLDICIYRQNGSNHYLTEQPNGGTIEIANYDAWVHRQLEDCEWRHLFAMGSYHQHKVHVLLEMCKEEDASRRIRGFCMKNGTTADEILIDECQDFEAARIHLLIAILRLHPHVRATFAGDYMQTIFERSIESGSHPMRIITKQLTPQRFRIQTCYRCPPGHLDFANTIMSDALAQHDCLPLLPAINNTNANKPLLFTHGSASKQYDVLQLTGQLCDMLEVLVAREPDLKPSDIAFLMRKSNEQSVFEHLRMRLETFWNQHGHRNAVIHFATQFDGYRNCIQWGFAEDKSCLLSIHGDKGKGHRVVFFLGLTQQSIPDECSMYKDTELLYQSLLNVAITRSVSHLFIGFHHARPSIYLSRIHEQLHRIAHLAWDVSSDRTPSLYQELAAVATRFPPPSFSSRYREAPLLIPRLHLFSVTEMSRHFERPEELFGFRPRCETVVFGTPAHIHLPHDLYPILGHMAELMLLRLVSPTQFRRDLAEWSNPRAILFTEDERLLCWVHDFHLHRLLGTDLFDIQLKLLRDTHPTILQQDLALNEAILRLEMHPGYVLPAAFRTRRFEEDMVRFSDPDRSNEAIPFVSWWNLALLFHEIKSTQRRPYLHRHINLEMNGKQQHAFRRLLQNVRNLTSHFSGDMVFHPSHDVLAQITDAAQLEALGFINEPDLDERIYMHGYHYGIVGISDIYDRGNDRLFEIKASHVDFSMEWLLQNSLYASLPFRHKASGIRAPSNLVLANVITGKMHLWKSPQCHPRTIVARLLTAHRIPTTLIDHICRIHHKRLQRYHNSPSDQIGIEKGQ